MKLSHLAAAALLGAFGAAHAASISSTPGAPDPGVNAGETVVVDFDGLLAAGYSWSGLITTAAGSIAGAAQPAGNTTNFGYVSSALSPNWATLSTPDLKSISFYWGSIDTYNSVDVLGAGNVVLGTFGGSLVPPANGDQALNLTNQRVTFTAGAGEVITGLTFRSTGVAFEFDTIAAAPIPEPGTWALMLAGMGAMGFMARRRRQA